MRHALLYAIVDLGYMTPAEAAANEALKTFGKIGNRVIHN